MITEIKDFNELEEIIDNYMKVFFLRGIIVGTVFGFMSGIIIDLILT